MFFRSAVLAIGGAAILLGGVLLALMLAVRPEPRQMPKIVEQDILVAARPLPSGSLLRADDLRWQPTPPDKIPVGGYPRGQGNEFALFGAAVRHDLAAGEPLVADEIVKPSEPGFLTAALGPGMRAVTIDVNAAEADAGLVVPGDRVDVILTQSFNEGNVPPPNRSASETVLSDLRVIAVDQLIGMATPISGGGGGLLQPSQGRVPKTVTLEVTMQQAQEVMLARHLGKLQLALRGAGEATGPGFSDGSVPLPTWAYQVSPALRSLGHPVIETEPLPAASPSPPAIGEPRGAPAAVEVIRGSKVEERCFDPFGRALPDCATQFAAPPGRAPPTAAPARAAGPTS